MWLKKKNILMEELTKKENSIYFPLFYDPLKKAQRGEDQERAKNTKPENLRNLRMMRFALSKQV